MRAARTDGNQTAIVDGLRKANISVFITSGVGAGFPDLCCGYAGRNFLFEIKDYRKPKADRQLTPDQVKFFNAWQGSVIKIEHLHEALEFIYNATLRQIPVA